MSWRVGDRGDIGGVEWRVLQGRKAPDDMRLEIRAMEFVPVKMSLGFLFADFFFHNEETLFPTARGFQGGDRYVNFIRGAVYLGWEEAASQLEAERTAKQGRAA